jgi:glucokinase
MGDMPTGVSRKLAPGELCLALDFGGTKIAAGLVNWRSGRILRQERSHTAWERGAEVQIADMLALVRRLRLSPAEMGTSSCVGVSFGGPVDVASGIVLHSHRVPGWDQLPLAARLREVLARPVVMENDANAVALGEYRYGAGRGVEALVYLTVSTGIGGGIVLGGRLWRGSHGLAGEIGHMVVRVGGPLCSCGNRGCLESLASGLSIARRACEALDQQGQSTHLLALAGGQREGITAEVVFRAAQAGDALAAAVVRAAAEDLGLGIAMLCSIVDPARVILGGGVAKAGEPLLAPVREAFRRHAFPMLAGHVDIVPAQFPDDGGLLGAAALVAQAAGEALGHDHRS